MPDKTKATKKTEKVVEEIVETKEVVETVKEEKVSPTAKAGKRSSKSIKEAEEKQAKEIKKQDKTEDSEKHKVSAPPAKSKLERRSKNYKKSSELIDKEQNYKLSDAVSLSKKTSTVKFDATVELHVNLGVDPRHADQNIRDNLVLPNGVGKKVTVAVISDDDAAAKAAGADLSKAEEVFAKLDKNQLDDFDVLIASPSQMAKLGKYARILGPRGLMPNPKSGTVTTDITKAVSEAKTGKVEYRVDSTGIVHLGVGKVSFEENSLQQNIEAVLNSIKQNKPQSVKGNYIKSMYLTTSMGPSIKVDVVSLN
jgi:large subunit ribosomal protein L1